MKSAITKTAAKTAAKTGKSTPAVKSTGKMPPALAAYYKKKGAK